MKNFRQTDEDGESPKFNDTASSLAKLPTELRFSDVQLEKIIIYSILMVISAIGNISLLIVMMKRKSKSRIYILIMHLAIADLFMTFLIMPVEIGWTITVSWKAGDAMCRIMAFLKMFGLCLSIFIIICISINRYYAVTRPLRTLDIQRRGKILMLAWIGSVLCSVPQMLIYKVETLSEYISFTQCMKFCVSPSYIKEFSYSLFVMMVTFWFPLIVMIYNYTRILIEIYRRSRRTNEEQIHRSSNNFLNRARRRYLKMTITFISVFLICWSPPYVMMVWYWIDESSAAQVDSRIQRVISFLWCIYYSVNPIIYGMFIPKRNKTQLQSYSLKPINTAMELPIVARNPIF